MAFKSWTILLFGLVVLVLGSADAQAQSDPCLLLDSDDTAEPITFYYEEIQKLTPEELEARGVSGIGESSVFWASVKKASGAFFGADPRKDFCEAVSEANEPFRYRSLSDLEKERVHHINASAAEVFFELLFGPIVQVREFARLLGDAMLTMYDPIFIANAERNEATTLSATGLVGSQIHVAGMRIRRIGNPSDDVSTKKLLRIEHTSISPGEIESSWRLLPSQRIDLYISAGSVRIPRQQVAWKHFAGGALNIGLNVSQADTDAFFDGPVRVVGIVYQNRRQIGAFVFDGTQDTPPPPRPVIKASGGTSSVILSSANPAEGGFRIFRASAPGTPLAQTTDLGVKQLPYEDLSVEIGSTYYYRATRDTDGLESQTSPEVFASVWAPIQLKDRRVTSFSGYAGDPFSLSARAVTSAQAPIPRAQTTLRIDGSNVDLLWGETGQDGAIAFEYPAPVKAGSYLLSMGTRDGGLFSDVQVPLTVVAQPDVGTGLKVIAAQLSPALVSPGESTTLTLGVLNQSPEADSAFVTVRLVSLSGAESSTWISAKPVSGSGRIDFPMELPVGLATTPGEYALRISATSSSGLDETPHDAQELLPIHIADSTPSGSLTLRSQDLILDGVGSSVQVGDLLIGFANYVPGAGFLDGDVVLSVNDTTLAPTTPDPDDPILWFSDDHQVVIAPYDIAQVNIPSTDPLEPDTQFLRLEVRVWTPTLAAGPESAYVIAERGGTGAVVFRGDLDTPIRPTEGTDRASLANWIESDEPPAGGDGSRELRFSVPRSADFGVYSAWFSWSTDFHYLSHISIRVVPTRDLAVGSCQTANRDAINVPGARFELSCRLSNTGDYPEAGTASVLLSDNSSTLLTRNWPFSLSPGRSVTLQASIPTTSLDVGTYITSAHLPRLGDDSPNDNSASINLELSAHEALEVVVLPEAAPVNPGASVEIRTFVSGPNGSLSDAAVHARVRDPLGRRFNLALRADPARPGEYVSAVPSVLGGVFDVDASASRPLTKGGTGEGTRSVFAKARLTGIDTTVRPGETGLIGIQVSEVANLGGLAFELVDGGAPFVYSGIWDSGLLSSGGATPVSTQFSGTPEGVLGGISRLSDSGVGARVLARAPALSIEFMPTDAHDGAIEVESIRLVDGLGREIPTIVSGNAPTDVRHRPVFMSPEDRGVIDAAGDEGLLDIRITDPVHLQTVAVSLGYEPQNAQILEVRLDTGDLAFASDKSAPLKVSQHDPERGTITLAATRTSPVARSLTSPGAILGTIRYRSLDGQRPRFAVLTTELYTDVSGLNPPVVLEGFAESVEASPTSQASLELAAPQITPAVGAVFETAILAESVSDLFSFAADVGFDPNHLELLAVEEGPLLSERGAVSTTFSTSTNASGGSAIFGLSRLGPTTPEISVPESDTLVILRFRRLESASTPIVMVNTGLLRRSGSQIEHLVHNTELSEAPPGLELSVRDGWNMIGRPVETPHQDIYQEITDALQGSLFRFEGTYLPVEGTSTEAGAGYWLRTGAQASFTELGSPVTDLTISLRSGWNMISGPGCSVAAAAIVDPDAVVIPASLFGFDGQYFAASTLEAGQGYWVRASASGTVQVDCASSSKTGFVRAEPAGLQDPFGMIIVRDASGVSGRLSWQPEGREASSVDLLPPVAPGGQMDVRWGSGGQQTTLAGLRQGLAISLHHAVFPLSVNVSQARVPHEDESLVLEAWDGSAWTRLPEEPTGVVQVSAIQAAVLRARLVSGQESLPAQPTLAPLFPNPFGRSVNIRFGISEPGQVKVSVYDVLGRRLAVLLDAHREPGWYEVAVSAELMPGLYVFELVSGGRRATRTVLRAD